MNSIGYIVSDKVRGGVVSHRVQNIIIKHYANEHSLIYALPATESNLGDRARILSSIMENYRVILFYSLYIVLENEAVFNKVKHFIEKGGQVHFCAENILYDKSSFEELQSIYKINKEKERIGKIESSLHVFKNA